MDRSVDVLTGRNQAVTKDPPSNTSNQGFERPVAPSSPLAGLREKARQIKASTISMQVPKYEDPPMFVVYRRCTLDEINETREHASELSEEEANYAITCELLVRCCVGVFAKQDGKLVSTESSYMKDDGTVVGRPLTFSSPELAEILGLPEGLTHKATLEGLYPGEGEILAAGIKLIEFSGFVTAQFAQEFLGNS